MRSTPLRSLLITGPRRSAARSARGAARPTRAAAALVVVAAVLTPGTPAASATPGAQRHVIVMLTPDGSTAAPNSRAAADTLRGSRRARQQSLLDGARAAKLHIGHEKGFTLAVDAVAMTVPETEVDRLRGLPGVAAVYPDAPVRAATDVSVPLIGAPAVWQRQDAAGANVTGKGVTVAVVDTGVDYTHPDLGAGFGEGHKVVGGYDFVNDDPDPMDDNGHGTHVAGIIGGKAAEKDGITGVAPDVSLLAYKVMNENGEGETSDILAALEAAIDPANPHRADVVNMSLGGPGDGTDPLSQAANAVSAAGVVVVASAGNDGPGTGTISAPGAADDVITVGASTSGRVDPVAYAQAGTGKPITLQTYRGQLSANAPAGGVTAPVVSIGYGSPEEIAAAGDLHGRIALLTGFVAPSLEMLSQSDVDLAQDLEGRGAVGLIGGAPGGGGPVFAAQSTADARTAVRSGDLYRMDKLVVLGVDDTQYDELTRLSADPALRVRIEGVDRTDDIASFSSRGPTGRFTLKPDLVAPGVDIKSTVPTSLFGPGQYRLSGTSMAAPHVAGAAALLRQLHPGEAPALVKAALVGTAKPVGGTETDRGSGRLDVATAARAVVTATPPSVSFGLADLGGSTVGGSRTVTLTNGSTAAVTADLRVSGAATVKPSRVSIPARGSVRVTVSLRTKTPIEYAEISGLITVTPGRGPAVRVPYLLVASPFVVQSTPNPSDGHTTVWIVAPTALAAAPVVTVKPQHGRAFTVTPTAQGATAYAAELTVGAAGSYTVDVRGRTAAGTLLTGASRFDVTPVDVRRNLWQPVGPAGAGGALTTGPSQAGQGVMLTDYTAGPFVTADQGKTWTQLNRLPVAGAAGLGTVVIDHANPARWWYAVNDPYTGGRILRTDDGGRTWRPLDLPRDHIATLVADTRTRVLVAVTSAGLEVSTDGGDTWHLRATGVPAEVYGGAIGGDDLYLRGAEQVWKLPGIVTGTPGAPEVAYDSDGQFIYDLAADDGVVAALVGQVGVVGSHGAGWSTLKSLPFGASTLRLSGGSLFVGTYSGTGYAGANEGRDWTEQPLPSSAAVFYDYDKYADGTAAVTMTNGVFGADGVRHGVQGLSAHDLAVSGDTLLAATDSGVYRTRLPAASPEWGAAEGEGWIGLGAQFLSVVGQQTWRVRPGVFDEFFIDRSDDGGVTWSQIGNSAEKASVLFVDPRDPRHIVAGFQRLSGVGLATTTDGGATWKNLYQDTVFTAIAADPHDAKRMWLGSSDGLYRTDDGGVTVTKVLSGPVSALYADSARIVAGGTEIRVSTDGGRTFQTGDTGAGQVWVSDVIRSGTTLYAATHAFGAYGFPQGGRGVLRSTNGGRTWENISAGLQNPDATSLAVSPDGKWLFVGTENGGVHRMPIG